MTALTRAQIDAARIATAAQDNDDGLNAARAIVRWTLGVVVATIGICLWVFL